MSLTLARLLRHLRDHATRYYPDLGNAELHVDCIGSREGTLSRVYRFRIRSRGRQRGVVVKLPPAKAPLPRSPTTRRIRVAPPLDPFTKYENEHVALRAIERHFDALGDRRFGAVRILDFLPDERAVVMEEVRGRPLTSLVARAHRLRWPLGCPRLEAAFRNTGAWLRAYHELPALPHTRRRSATPDEFVACVQRLAGFLLPAHPRGGALAAAASRVEALASACLPPMLPLATSHGDLAPRNVLVDEGGRVTVLDTRAAWLAPIYEDIAYFLTAAKTPRAQARSLGLAFAQSALGRLEAAFLGGYFGSDPVPLQSIRLFELQCLLDKWASNTHGRSRGVGLGRIAGAYRDWSADRLFDRSIAGVLARLAPLEAVA